MDSICRKLYIFIILMANKGDYILVTPPPHILLLSLRRNFLDEKNGSFLMCRVSLNLLYIIVWEGQRTEKVSWTQGFSNVHLLLAKDLKKTLYL